MPQPTDERHLNRRDFWTQWRLLSWADKRAVLRIACLGRDEPEELRGLADDFARYAPRRRTAQFLFVFGGYGLAMLLLLMAGLEPRTGWLAFPITWAFVIACIVDASGWLLLRRYLKRRASN